jgi:hypothetical protein
VRDECVSGGGGAAWGGPGARDAGVALMKAHIDPCLNFVIAGYVLKACQKTCGGCSGED